MRSRSFRAGALSLSVALALCRSRTPLSCAPPPSLTLLLSPALSFSRSLALSHSRTLYISSFRLNQATARTVGVSFVDTTPPELNKPDDKTYEPCETYTAPIVVARDVVDGDLTAFAQSYYYSAAVVASGNGRCPDSGTSAHVDTVYVKAEPPHKQWRAYGVEEGRRSDLTLTCSLAPPPPSPATP